jgi:hypothetical protein
VDQSCSEHGAGTTEDAADGPALATISVTAAEELQLITSARKYIEEARAEGARTYGELARSLNEKAVKAPYTRRWSAAAVARILLPYDESRAPATCAPI